MPADAIIDDLGERRGIQESEIDALAGERVYDVGCVPKKRHALGHVVLRSKSAER